MNLESSSSTSPGVPYWWLLLHPVFLLYKVGFCGIWYADIHRCFIFMLSMAFSIKKCSLSHLVLFGVKSTLSDIDCICLVDLCPFLNFPLLLHFPLADVFPLCFALSFPRSNTFSWLLFEDHLEHSSTSALIYSIFQYFYTLFRLCLSGADFRLILALQTPYILMNELFPAFCLLPANVCEEGILMMAPWDLGFIFLLSSDLEFGCSLCFCYVEGMALCSPVFLVVPCCFLEDV